MLWEFDVWCDAFQPKCPQKYEIRSLQYRQHHQQQQHIAEKKWISQNNLYENRLVPWLYHSKRIKLSHLLLNVIWHKEKFHIKPLSLRMNDKENVNEFRYQCNLASHFIGCTIFLKQLKIKCKYSVEPEKEKDLERKKKPTTRIEHFAKCRIIMNAIRRIRASAPSNHISNNAYNWFMFFLCKHLLELVYVCV